MTDFQLLAAPGVRALRPYEPGKPVDELAREYGVSEAIKLASNENPLGPSSLALAAVENELGKLARYPDGNGFTLKQSLAAMHGVDADQITLGNGSNDILELLTRAFVTPADEVMFYRHAFAVYPIVTQAVGATAVIVDACMDEGRGQWYGHDLAAMAEAITDRTRLVFVANPNNPTGTWLEAAELETFVQSLPSHVIVVVDEAYFEYARDLVGDSYPDTSGWITRYDNLVVTRTFSKLYGLAGLRVGYAISHPGVADLLNRVRQPFNVNSLALAGAVAALSDTDHVTRSLQVNRDGLAFLQQAFDRMGLRWLATAANFISVQLPRPGREIYQQLLQSGVITRPVDNYAMPDFLRITVGTGAENQRFVEALEKIL
jgi:histidinol-phosphate aminotransferase